MASTPQPIPIADLTLSTSPAYVEFSNIPQGFTHLYLEMKVRSTNTSGNVAVLVNFNNDTTGTNYSYWTMQGSAVTATAYGTSNSSFFGVCTNTDYPANTYGVSSVHIPFYNRTDRYKTTQIESTNVSSSATAPKFYELIYNLWKSTAAINTIKLTTVNGNIASGSTFTLYGVNNTDTNGTGTATTTP